MQTSFEPFISSGCPGHAYHLPLPVRMAPKSKKSCYLDKTYNSKVQFFFALVSISSWTKGTTSQKKVSKSPLHTFFCNKGGLRIYIYIMMLYTYVPWIPGKKKTPHKILFSKNLSHLRFTGFFFHPFTRSLLQVVWDIARIRGQLIPLDPQVSPVQIIYYNTFVTTSSQINKSKFAHIAQLMIVIVVMGSECSLVLK